MSGLINKAKEMLSGDKDNHHATGTHTTGSHGAHSTSHNTDYNTGIEHHNNPSSGYGSSTSGAFPGSTGTHSNTAGPHSSNLANKMDPRVDSDMDNRNNPTSRVGGYGGQENYGVSGSNPTSTSGYGSGHGTAMGTHSTQGYGGSGHSSSNTSGPHSSNLANKLDPRVDSDRDNRNDPTSRVGGYGSQGNYGSSGANPVPSSGYQGTSSGVGGGMGGYGSSSATGGPHQSNVANRMDPRVDSDYDGRSGMGGSSNFGSGHDQYSSTSTGGPHQSSMANRMDPRVDSDYDGRSGMPGHSGVGQGQYGNTGVGSGMTGSHPHSSTGAGHSATGGYSDNNYSSTGTAGPHNSNLLNKLDPRVDSDRDGSKTYGGNKTNY